MNFGYTTLNEDLKKVLNETISTETYQIYQSDILQYISDNQNIDINELASDYASTNSSPPVFTSSSVSIQMKILKALV